MAGASEEISEGVKAYLLKLTEGLSAQIKSLQDNIITKDQRIIDLSENVTQVVHRNLELTSELHELRQEFKTMQNKYSKLDKKYNQLEIKVDDGQQYQRKQNLRIEGIEILDRENNDKLEAKVVSTLNDLGADIKKTDIFRLHRSGKKHRAKKDGVLVAQTIVRFRNWPARRRAYLANQKAKSKKSREHIRLDLTARRLALLDEARDALDDHPFAHAYADAECNLLVKDRNADAKYYFNSHPELVTALSYVGIEPITDAEFSDSDDDGNDDGDVDNAVDASDHEVANASVDSIKLVDRSAVSEASTVSAVSEKSTY